jgi:hypothetical protein
MFTFAQAEGILSYSVNHVKEPEWRTALKDLEHPVWRRSERWQRFRLSIWILLLLVSGFLGALLSDVSKDFYKSKIGPNLFSQNSSSTNSSERK